MTATDTSLMHHNLNPALGTAADPQPLNPRPQPRLRRPDRQLLLQDLHLDDLLDRDHQARLVWQFVQGLDLSPLLNDIQAVEGRPGHPAADPAVLVALWLYATLEGIGSARALDELCRQHHAFRWLCGGVRVNYHSLADFRVQHLEFLDQLLTDSVAVLREQELVDLNRVAQDGMRVRASAGAASFRRRPTLQECLQEAQQQVARLQQERDHDAAAPTRRQAAARQRAARERQQRLQQALQRLPEMEARKKADSKEQARASSTDAEATVMKMADGGFRPAYNVQYSVDTGSQVITGVEVICTGSDAGQLPPMLEQLHDRYGVYPKEALVDGSYASHADLEAVSKPEIGCTVYAPVPQPRNAERDRYRPLPSDSEAVASWRVRMGTAAAPEIYKERAATVECINAQARNRGLLQFRVRGRLKVKAVALWYAIAHNVHRAWSLGVQLAAAALPVRAELALAE